MQDCIEGALNAAVALITLLHVVLGELAASAPEVLQGSLTPTTPSEITGAALKTSESLIFKDEPSGNCKLTETL